MSARDAIAIFAKAPRPGRSKTRLAAVLGEEAAARLAAAFLEDLVARLARLEDTQVALFAASAEDVAPLEALGLPVEVQPEGDLGARMSAALGALLARSERALVIGSDLPTLPLSRLRAAARALDDADLVLGPATDGGFYLVGARAPGFDFGEQVRWSSHHALADTLARAAASGRRVARVRPHYDVDVAEDLALLRLHLALDPRAAPATAAVLATNSRTRR